MKEKEVCAFAIVFLRVQKGAVRTASDVIVTAFRLLLLFVGIGGV